MIAEQRRELRESAVIDGTFRTTDGRQQGSFMLTDYSRQGIRAALSRAIEPGSRIECEIHQPHKSMPLFTVGTVIWVKAKPVQRSFGFDAGIRLDNRDAFESPQLQGFCFAPWRLRKIAEFALQRGYFARQFPEQHRKLHYFVPTMVCLYLVIAGLTALVFPLGALAFALSLVITASMIFLNGVGLIKRELKGQPLLRQCGCLLSYCLGKTFAHISYGWYFLKGLCSRRMVG